MKNNPVDRFKDEQEQSTGTKTPAKPQHVKLLSSVPSDYEMGNEALERCLKELATYFRHSSVGRRCLGVVHQMNTPLQIISFQLDLLEQKALEERELLKSSDADVDKLVTLSVYREEKFRQLRQELKKLQTFARSLVLQGVHEGAEEMMPLDLNQLYRQELELYLADPIFKHQVSKEFHFGEMLPLIYGYYIDFSQSFRNLIDNALEAMEGSKHRHLTVITAYHDKKLTLRIGDTGVGIPPENLPFIFDPFSTTKQTSGGVRAGLGLFMARRLLAPYEAEIRVDSEPGETWVTVSLPLR
jgi:two-component system, NtrC family, sensor kinase